MADVKEAVRELIKIMKSSGYPLEIRMAATEGLGFAGGQEAREELIAVAKSSGYPQDLRVVAAKAIGHATKA